MKMKMMMTIFFNDGNFAGRSDAITVVPGMCFVKPHTYLFKTSYNYSCTSLVGPACGAFLRAVCIRSISSIVARVVPLFIRSSSIVGGIQGVGRSWRCSTGVSLVGEARLERGRRGMKLVRCLPLFECLFIPAVKSRFKISLDI